MINHMTTGQELVTSGLLRPPICFNRFLVGSGGYIRIHENYRLPSSTRTPNSQSPLLPPRFLTTLASPTTIPLSTALHISYTVNAAARTDVSASISTPVRP